MTAMPKLCLLDHEFLEEVRYAGKTLLAMQRAGGGQTEFAKADGSVATACDVEAQRILIESIHKRFPDFPILAEESRLMHLASDVKRKFRKLRLLDAEDEVSRLPSRYVSIDPADGTVFLQNGSPDFAVSVAIVDNYQPVAAVVYQPARDVLWAWPQATECPFPELKDDEKRLQESMIGLDNCKAAGSRFRDRVITPLVEACRYPENLGSVTSGIHLLQGVTRAWLTNNAKNWDIAATALLVAEAGGVTCQLRMRNRHWYTASIPWDRVQMPAILFAASERMAQEVVDVLNGHLRFRRKPR